MAEEKEEDVRAWLGTLVDVVTIAGAIAVLALVGERYVTRSSSTGGASPGMGASLLNTQIGGTFGVDFTATERTALVVFRQECPACVESLPFYRRLTEPTAAGVQVVFAAPEENADVEGYLASHDVDPDAIVFTPTGRENPFFATPTLAIVDKGGVITHVWVGSLPRDAEVEVLDELFGA